LNTYVVSRTMRPSVTKNRRRHFASSPFFSFYLSIFFALSSLTAWFDFGFLYCVSKQQQQQVFVRLLLYYIVPLFVHYTQYIQYNVCSFSLFLLLPPSFFFKKKPILTDCFFSVGLFFMRVCFFVSTAVVGPTTAFLCRLQYVCAYVWKEKREEKHNDRSRSKKKEKLRIALVWWLWLLLFLLILTECKIIISIVMFSDQIKDYRSSRTPVL
jgi:hypothetical protein